MNIRKGKLQFYYMVNNLSYIKEGEELATRGCD